MPQVPEPSLRQAYLSLRAEKAYPPENASNAVQPQYSRRSCLSVLLPDLHASLSQEPVQKPAQEAFLHFESTGGGFWAESSAVFPQVIHRSFPFSYQSLRI